MLLIYVGSENDKGRFKGGRGNKEGWTGVGRTGWVSWGGEGRVVSWDGEGREGGFLSWERNLAQPGRD